MSPAYNRGEWAELYVLAKLLCEQVVKVHSHGEAAVSKELEILRLRRGNASDVEEFLVNGDEIVCIHSGKRTQRSEVCERLQPLISGIKEGRGLSFSLAIGDELLAVLGITQLKKGSREKSDIYLDVRDPLTGDTGWQGYTAKALLGSQPTLFNASEPTNFEYRIDPPLSDYQIAHYNEKDATGKMVRGPRETVAELMSLGHVFTLVGLDERFRENLELLDSEMPAYLSELVLAYYAKRAGKATAVSALIGALVESNPLGVTNPRVRYQHKVKDFLEASAYGMVPTEPYNGERTATGGLLLVEEDGELTCFRLDDKNRSREYLAEHTYLETPSRKRHRFGVLTNSSGETRLKLNLQVRYR